MKKAALILMTLLVPLMALDSQAQGPTVETFFSNPAVDKCQLSPDGKTLALLSTHEGFLNIHVLDIASGKLSPVTREKFDVVDFFWSGNDYFVYSNALFNDDNPTGRIPLQLFSVQRGGGSRRTLSFRGSVNSKTVLLPRLLHRLPEDPIHIVVSLRISRGSGPDVFKFNIETGQLQRLLKNPGGLENLVTDEKGTPRFGTVFNPDGTHSSFYRPARSDQWIPFLGTLAELDNVEPVAMASSKDIGVTVSNLKQDKKGLFKVHYKDGLLSNTASLSHHSCDIDAKAIYSYGAGGFVGVSYEELQPRQMFFDTNFKNLHALIDEKLPNAFNHVISFNEGGSTLILESISSNRPIDYYKVTLESGLTVKRIAQSNPKLAGVALRGARSISFRASDGQLIHAYLTLPETYSSGQPVPLVLIPHDGPWKRVTWGIRDWTDYVPEFYASRGFAVLRVNYRGSSGFGKKHMSTAFNNLERIHLDLIESIQWAIGEGYADKNRIGISGIGWGGYAALSAMTQRPDLFKFGVTLEGIFDLEKYILTMAGWSPHEETRKWKSRVGDPASEGGQAYLRKWSPIHHVSALNAPVFVYHGARGDRVEFSQSELLVNALNVLAKDHRFIRQPDKTFPSFCEQSRIGLFNKLDSFLQGVTSSW